MLIRIEGKSEALENLNKAKELISEAEFEIIDDTKKTTAQDTQ